jgi:glycosyltransferase involved in cell wall biosynthesis
MKTLGVLVPIFNEERTIQELVNQLAAIPHGIVTQVIFIDDGSTDNSVVFLKDALKENKLPHLVLSKKNEGKASAIRSGSSELQTSHVVILDSDLELAPAEIARMWAVVESSDSDFVFGYRKFLSHSSFTWRYSRGNQMISNLYGLFFNEVITDIMCGYKLIPTSSLQSLPYRYKKFGLEIEIPMQMWRLRQRPFEIEVSYKARTRAEGKSISVFDAIAVILSMITFRITNRRMK